MPETQAWKWLMFIMLPLTGCTIPLTAEMLQALKNDPASMCVIAKAQGGAGGMAITPVPIPSGGYGSADLVICRTNEPGSKIVLDEKGALTIEHGRGATQ